RLAVYGDVVDQEFGLAAFGVEMREHLQGARHDRAGAEVAHGQRRIVEQLRTDLGPTACAVQPGSLQFVGVVEQASSLPAEGRRASQIVNDAAVRHVFRPRRAWLSTDYRPRP